MTDEQKLTLLIGVLKTYAEQKHCYNKYGDDFNPNDYTSGDVAFEVGSCPVYTSDAADEQRGVELGVSWII